MAHGGHESFGQSFHRALHGCGSGSTKLSGPSNADPVPTTRSAVKSSVFLEFATKTYTCVCLSGDIPIEHQLLFSMIALVQIS